MGILNLTSTNNNWTCYYRAIANLVKPALLKSVNIQV